MLDFYTLFLIVSVLLAVAADWNIWACIFVICAAILELINITPKLWRSFSKKH